MKRRDFCKTVTGACMVGAAMAHEEKGKPGVPTFVLVHGAWHGGWCWKKVVPLLRASGHDVFVPTLTGLGERVHLLSPEIDLATHVRDVVALIEFEDLRDVVLVGHSYGGMVIAGASARVGQRIAGMVYVDAFMPENGRALSDYGPVPPARQDGWRVPPIGPPEAFDVTDARDIAWMTPLLGDQPLKTFTQPADLAGVTSSHPKTTYIQCTQAPFFVEAAQRARRLKHEYRELFAAGHDAMVTKPRALAHLMLEAAAYG